MLSCTRLSTSPSHTRLYPSFGLHHPHLPPVRDPGHAEPVFLAAGLLGQLPQGGAGGAAAGPKHRKGGSPTAYVVTRQPRAPREEQHVTTGGLAGVSGLMLAPATAHVITGQEHYPCGGVHCALPAALAYPARALPPHHPALSLVPSPPPHVRRRSACWWASWCAAASRCCCR